MENQNTEEEALKVIPGGKRTVAERNKSLEWVLRVFEPMIRKREQVLCVYFAEIESTEWTREAGLTNLAHGATRIVSMTTERMSLEYIDIILDETLTDSEKVRAMMRQAKEEKVGTYDQAWKFFDTPDLKLETRLIA